MGNNLALASPPTELISKDQEFKEQGFKEFISVNVNDDVSSAVVAIIGSQSSGKSTLLNHIFDTNFQQWNPSMNKRGFGTTKGVWIAKAHNMPNTLVMDLEGTDSSEKGENDTVFEKQSAEFALLFADILIINMWSKNVGLEHGANRPLLRIMFEVGVKMPLFKPRKTTLFFVTRDTVPFDQSLKDFIIDDVQKIWENVRKPRGREHSIISEYFNVEFYALPSFENKLLFKKEVANLRQKFSDLISGRLHHDDSASWLRLNAKAAWEIIQKDKDLNLPALKEMVATVRCKSIAEEKLKLFASNKTWLAVKEATETNLVQGFGAILSSMLKTYLDEYDSEAEYFDEVVKDKERKHLVSELKKEVRPAYDMTVDYYRTEALQSFKYQFEEVLSKLGTGVLEELQQCCVRKFDERSSVAAIEQTDWDTTIVHNELLCDIETHALPQLEFIFREQVCRELTEKLNGMFYGVDDIIEWASLREIIKEKSDALSSALAVFKLNQPTIQRVVNKLMQYAKDVVEMKFTKELQEKGAVKLMMERFLVVFAQNSPSSECSGRTTKEEAYCKCRKLLSTMEVIRLDETEVTLITPTERDEILLQFSMKIDDSYNKAEYVEEKCKDDDPWPFWVKLGLVAVDVYHFIEFLRKARFELAVPLLPKIAKEGGELASDFAKITKLGWKKTKKEISKMMTALEEAFKKFLDFMKSMFTKRQCSTTY